MSLISPWRGAFPGIRALEAEGQTYLDSAATAQKPQAVLDALLGYLASGAANVHRAQHLPGERATRTFEGTRDKAAAWLNAASREEILFTRGSTESLNLLAYGLEHLLQPGDEIAISALEHHANLLPWQQLALRRGLRLVVLPLDGDGAVDLAQAATLIGPRTRLLAVSQLSNVLGRWQPLQELLTLARAHGAISVVDGAQGAVHGRHDLQALGCDFYVCSAHKLYGPDGVGLLYGRSEALGRLHHWQFGGEMVLQADYPQSRFRPAPLGFEAGTPPVSGVIALGAALDWLTGLDQAAVAGHEAALHAKLLAGLAMRDGVRLLGAPQLALASFCVDGVHNADLAHLLSEQGIAVRAGHHCAMPLMKRLGLSGAIRVSLGLYNDGADLERFFGALDRALEKARPAATAHVPDLPEGNSAEVPEADAAALPAAAQAALEAFTACPGWEQRARLLMHWGERLAPLSEAERHEDNRVHGCESRVWLVARQQGGAWHFRADSDARLLRGLLAVLLARVEGLPGDELRALDLADWFSQLGLSRQLSPSRSNGLHAVLQRMRELAGT